MSLSEELNHHLLNAGASTVGYADLSTLVEGDMSTGISVMINLPTQIVSSIEDGPNMDYFNAYHDINDKLDKVVLAGEAFLKAKGYKAYAQTVDRVIQSTDDRTELPHKTVATNAGLGWIGKSALLVTKEYGTAVRISSLITNAKLDYGQPITKSLCGDCMVCHDACPGNAITGKLWNVNLDRNEFYDPVACRKKARELAAERIDREITLCGKCIEVCPYTRAYLRL